MPYYVLTFSSGAPLELEALNWTQAVKLGFSHLKLPANDVHIDVEVDGTLRVYGSKTSFRMKEHSAKPKPSAHDTSGPEARTQLDTLPLGAKPAPKAGGPLSARPKIAESHKRQAMRDDSGANESTQPDGPRTAAGRPPAPARALTSEVQTRLKKLCWGGWVKKAHEGLLELALELVPAEAGTVYDADAKGNLRFAAVWGPKTRKLREEELVIPAGTGLAGFCVSERMAFDLSDVEKDPRFHASVAKKLDYRVRCVLCVPVLAGDQVKGCLQLLNRKGAAAFSADEVQLLCEVAGHIDRLLRSH